MAKWEEAPIIQPLVPPSAVREQPTDSQPATPGFEGNVVVPDAATIEGGLVKQLVRPAPPVAPAAESPPATPGFEGNVVVPGAATIEGGGALGRIGSAAVEGFRSAPNFYKPEMHAAVDQGPVGRFLTNPLLDTASGVLGGLAHGIGQAAYETGNAIGGPQLGRDFYMGNQVAPVAAIGAPLPNRLLAAPERPPEPKGFPLSRAEKFDAFMSRLSPEERARWAETSPEGKAWLAQRQSASPPAGPNPVAEPPTPAPAPAPTAPAAPITTTAQAKAVASSLYKIADQADGTLTPNFVGKWLDGVGAKLPQTEAGKAVAGESPTAALAERMKTLRDKPMTIQAVQEVDEALSGLIDKEYGVKGISKEGQRLLDIQHSLRDHIAEAGAGDITGGTAGFDALSQARKAWSQAMKMDDLERIQYRASLTDNPATSIKTQVRTLLTNRAKSRGYDAAEIAALEEAAQRGVIGGALHVFGSRLVPMVAGAAGASGGLASSIISAGVAHLGTAKLRDWGTALQQNRLSNAMGVLGQSVPNQFLAPPP